MRTPRASSWLRIFVAVVRREIVARRSLLALAVALGVGAPLVAWMPFIAASETGAVQEANAIFVLAAFFIYCTLSLGAQLFVDDQAAGRTFTLARPITAGQLLTGRLAAGAALLAVGLLLTILPSTLVGVDLGFARIWESWGPTWPSYGTALFMPWDWQSTRGAFASDVWSRYRLAVDAGPAGALVILWSGVSLLAFGHLAAVALRLRDRWTLVDLVAGVLVWFLAWQLSAQSLAARLIPFSLVWILLGAWLVILLGLWVQLRFGGAQQGRVHRLFSCTVWPPLLLALFASQAHLSDLVEPDPNGLEQLAHVLPAPDGGAVVVSGGLAPSIQHIFVRDLRQNRIFHLGRLEKMAGKPVWVDDRTLVWQSCLVPLGLPGQACGLSSLDLEEETPQVRVLQQPAPWPSWGQARERLSQGACLHEICLDLSPDGRRFALVHDERIVEIDSATLETIRQVEIPKRVFARRVRYASEGQLVLFAMESAGDSFVMGVYEVLGEQSTTTLERRTEIRGFVQFDVGRDALVARGLGGVSWIDLPASLEAGRRVSHAFPQTSFPMSLRPLADGRVVLHEPDRGLTAFDPRIGPTTSTEIQAQNEAGEEGSVQPKFWPLGLGGHDLLGQEVRPGILLVGIDPAADRSWSIDLDHDETPFRAETSMELWFGDVGAWHTVAFDVDAGRPLFRIRGMVPLWYHDARGVERGWLLDRRGRSYRLSIEDGDARSPRCRGDDLVEDDGLTFCVQHVALGVGP